MISRWDVGSSLKQNPCPIRFSPCVSKKNQCIIICIVCVWFCKLNVQFAIKRIYVKKTWCCLPIMEKESAYNRSHGTLTSWGTCRTSSNLFAWSARSWPSTERLLVLIDYVNLTSSRFKSLNVIVPLGSNQTGNNDDMWLW